MAHRDDHTEYEDPYIDETDPYAGPRSEPPKPGDSGYRMGGWATDYDPGANWNNGVAPNPSDPYSNYNSGSPIDAPLTAGSGWEWSGPQDAIWNTGTNAWDYGRWNQVVGRGLGYVPTPGPPPGPPPGPRPGPSPGPSPGPTTGAVPAINVPSAGLPGNVAGVFARPQTQTPVQSAYQTALLNFMGRSQETPSLSDPTLAPQVEVFRAGQQRGQERQRLSNAERAAATGQSQSGYLDNLINQGVQDQGFNTSAFNANLLGGEMSKRRQELQSALQLASATGNQEATGDLQRQLAEVSAMMQQSGLNLQGELGRGDLGLRLQQLLMGNTQFYDQLGSNNALNMEGLNQRALQILLEGST